MQTNPFVDFRSDTVTRPTPGMWDAMQRAQVGDDVYGEDPLVNQLQEYAANLFGMEAALFCASGTMTNQIAIGVHCGPLSEVICDQQSHIYLYEGGGIAHNTKASVRLLAGDRGRITAQQVEAAINADDIHHPISRLVSLENTANRGGGACYDFAEIARIKAVTDRHSLRLHLDGARLFNALVATGQSAKDYGRVFRTISICLSKGLGAPVGSLLLGPKEDIAMARRLRKVMGGGWRQAGMLAAAGLYALEHQVARLADDHRRAKALGETVASLPWVAELLPVETNLVLFRLKTGVDKAAILAQLKENGILAGGPPDHIRMVVHLDVNDAGVERAQATLKAIKA